MPEAAQLALEQMNSVLLGGRNIKVWNMGYLRVTPLPKNDLDVDQLGRAVNDKLIPCFCRLVGPVTSHRLPHS